MKDLNSLAIQAINVCPCCAQPCIGGMVCGACQQKSPPFDYLWASVYYQPPIIQLLHAFKDQADLSVLPALLAMLKQHPPPWLHDLRIDAVLAMPLSKERRLYRGFNQIDELVAKLAKHYGWSVLPRKTVLRHAHPPQSTLKGDQRRQNVRNAFSLQNHLVKNRKLLLMDDVVRTGATLHKFALTLKKSGVEKIFCWILARVEMQKF